MLDPLAEKVLAEIGNSKNLSESLQALEHVRGKAPAPPQWQKAYDNFVAVIESNRRFQIPAGADLSQFVLFPSSFKSESHGIEDLRLVLFTDEDGSTIHYGTYTAFNGYTIFPTLMIVNDKGSIQTHTMLGRYAQNKGMALFPR